MQNSLPTILGTGLSGLIGSKISDLYQDKYNFVNLDISHPTNPVDITHFDQVKRALDTEAEYVLHCAAFTDVTKAWEQKDDTSGLAYKVNVLGTQNIVAACQQTGKHLLHISTAYVFDGEKEGLYSESDLTSPIEWYGQTKALAEEAVQASNGAWTILRIDQPFRSDPFPRKDLVHRVISGLENDSLPPLFINHFFGPTFIDDFAQVIDWVIRTKTTGLFHASSGEKWTDFEFGKAIQTALNLSGEVKPGKLEDYLKKSSRPYQRNTALDNSKLVTALDFELTPIREALRLVR